MPRVAVLVSVVVASVVGQALPTRAAFSEISLTPDAGTVLMYDGRAYAGTLTVRAAADGLVVVEQSGVDRYLEGIREVPPGWPDEALAAQVVAARTYLAWTLAQGRSGDGRRYGFDICATTSCQVYAGVALDPDSERWRAAVERTAGEILVYAGRPAQAMYHSTSGGRTEAIEDIFGGAPVPYLAGTDSPGEQSPYVDWSFELRAGALVMVLRDAGYTVGGVLRSVSVVQTPRGEGPWRVRVVSSSGVTDLSVNRLRAIMNRYGPARFPGLLPAVRPGGGRYPQAVLSYRYTIDYTPSPVAELRALARQMLGDDEILPEGTVRFEGHGWGHHVGMSQYGALAMAEAGHTYPEILAHYYGGLEPEPGALPTEVSIGLSWGNDEVTIMAGGPVTVRSGGIPLSRDAGGPWIIRRAGGGELTATAPAQELDRLLARVGELVPFL